MQAHNNNIEEFLGQRTVFIVPVFQRNYDWKKENCKQLFQDIIGVIQTGQEHFIGTILFKVNSSYERSVIDGQQRLTSITLLLKAICDFDDNCGIQEEINDRYLYNKLYGKGRDMNGDFLRIKLHLNKRDDTVYRILLDSTKTKAEERLSFLQKNTHIYQNYMYFYEMISEFVENGGSVACILDALRKLTIIELEIQQENPQEIFESMNSTGLNLTKIDLLRNYLLMQFSHDEQTRLYEDYWSQIEEVIGVERMEQFFVDFIVFRKLSDSITINGRRNHVTERNLDIAFKNYFASLPEDDMYVKTRNCFADLKMCAELYKNFIFFDDISLDRESLMRRKLYFLLSINDSSKARSLLLYIFDLHRKKLIDDTALNVAVDGISSLTFRARVCRAQGINRQFAGSVMQRLNEISDYSQFVKLFWQAITSGKGSYAFPSDAEFMDALVHRDLYQVLRSRGTKYLLYTLEANSPFPKGLPAFDDETISIEHIMPQKLNVQWKNCLTKDTMEHYESSLHRLGNLALTNYNGEMSNKSFEDKKLIYKDSNYHYTRMIVEYEKWQIVEINDRSQKLAEEALKIWQLPAEYQKEKFFASSLYQLTDDMPQFAYSKPSLLRVDEHEYLIDNWYEILPIICGLLETESHDSFVEIANPNNISAFVINDNEHDCSENKNFIHIVDDIYVRKYYSSTSILKMVMKIVTEFDQIAGTDYNENIYFLISDVKSDDNDRNSLSSKQINFEDYYKECCDVKNICDNVCNLISSFGDDVTRKDKLLYTAFSRRKNKNFAYVKKFETKIKIYINLPTDSVILDNVFARDVTELNYNYGACKLELTVMNKQDFERAKPLLERAYREN